MSGEYNDNYDEYSDDTARKAGRAQKRVESVVDDIANERPVTTSTGRVVRPPPAGHGDTVMSIIKLSFFIVIMGLSAAAVAKTKEQRDAGSTATCFNAAYASYGLAIGILVVSTIAVVHTIFVMILSISKKLPGVRYAAAICLIPHCLVLVILGAIVLGYAHPFPGAYASTGLSFVNADDETACRDVEPFRIVWVTGAVTVALAGFLLLMIPFMVIMACYNDVVNNPKLRMAQEVIMEEGKAAAAKANRGRRGEPAAEFAVKKGRAKGREAARQADSEISSALDESE